jgi:hypothetical protein
MQKAILIKDGTLVKGKFVYGGDVSSDAMNAEVIRLQAKYPTYTITLFNDDQDSIFVNAIVDSPIVF